LPATAAAIAHGHHVRIDPDEKLVPHSKDEQASKEADVQVHPVEEEESGEKVTSTVDFAVNEALTFKTGMEILANPLTWLPALAYFTTFGLVRSESQNLS
jgi:NNP family nitrate/nitrite transporter-like MFS transporter